MVKKSARREVDGGFYCRQGLPKEKAKEVGFESGVKIYLPLMTVCRYLCNKIID